MTTLQPIVFFGTARTPFAATLRAPSRTARAWVAGFSLMAASGWAMAAGPATDTQYRKETARCTDGTSQQDKATCLREAGAARQEAQRGRLDGAQPTGSNATDRCKALPAQERSECEARMAGQGKASGSVNGGGVIREITTTGQPTTAPATPAKP